MDGNLTRLCLEHFSLHADDISDIHLLEILVCLLADAVPSHIRLDIPALVENITERCLPHDTLLHNTPRQRDLRPFQFLKMLFNIHGMACHVKLCNLKRIFPVAL